MAGIFRGGVQTDLSLRVTALEALLDDEQRRRLALERQLRDLTAGQGQALDHASAHGNDHHTGADPVYGAYPKNYFLGTPSTATGTMEPRALVAADIPVSTLYSYVYFIGVPDAAPGATITASSSHNGQGNIYHSGPNGFTATKLYVDAETAPGASGLPITWEYGDTDDLDTVSSWTTIASYTLSSEKSNSTTSMTNAAVPANRLVQMTIGTIVGTPKDCTSTLVGRQILST